MITPADIENKEFSIVKRGYSEQEVDEYLDLIIVDMEKLIRENRQLKEELAKASTQVDKHLTTETSIYETLEAAKQLMNDIAASAERRAEQLLKNAEMDASLITREARDSIQKYTDEGNRLMKSADRLRERYKQMLKDEIVRIDFSADSIIAEFEDDFLPASLTEKDDIIIAKPKNEIKREEPQLDLSKTMVITKNEK